MKKVSIPCPDGLPGCMVAHYAWAPEEEEESIEDRLIRVNDELREDLRKLKEGLEFYAEIQNWETFSSNTGQIATLIEEDTGLMARTILEKVKI